jgi:hypothetical protein
MAEHLIEILDKSSFDTKIIDNIYEASNIVKSFSKNFHNIRVLNLNIRSISKNFELLETLLGIMYNDFDFIILTETWQVQNVDFF